MFKGAMSKEQYDAFVQQYIRATDDPNMSPTQKLITMHRMYEKYHYGVTTRDLARGYEERTVWDDHSKKWVTLHSRVRGAFQIGGPGNNHPSRDPVLAFERTKFKVADGKRQPVVETFKSGNPDGDIKFAPETTIRDMGDGASLLETNVDALYGTATGVVTPVFVNRMMRLTAEKVMAKNFVQVVPMDSMNFYFPIRNSRVSDNTTAWSPTVKATSEGKAGLDINVKYTKWEANGWKFLRHAEYSYEIEEMVQKFINVTGDLAEDLALGHALLWDWSCFHGMYDMITRGFWRRWDRGDDAFTSGSSLDETEIPFGKASVLTTNAKKNYIFQDGTTGILYEPAVTTGNEMKFDSSTQLSGSSSSDLLMEGLVEVCHLQKMKKSKPEFLLMPKKLTRLLFKDARMSNQQILTGQTKFQDEAGYLGQINIVGTTSVVDVWEYDEELFGQQTLDDASACKVDVVFCGAYGKFWNLGVFTPFYLRVDEGYEVLTSGVGGASVLRNNETKVLTSGSKGSSFPNDYHHLSLLLWTDRVHA